MKVAVATWAWVLAGTAVAASARDAPFSSKIGTKDNPVYVQTVSPQTDKPAEIEQANQGAAARWANEEAATIAAQQTATYTESLVRWTKVMAIATLVLALGTPLSVWFALGGERSARKTESNRLRFRESARLLEEAHELVRETIGEHGVPIQARLQSWLKAADRLKSAQKLSASLSGEYRTIYRETERSWMDRFYVTLRLRKSFADNYFSESLPPSWGTKAQGTVLHERTLGVIYRFAWGEPSESLSVDAEPPLDEVVNENVGAVLDGGAVGLAVHVKSLREKFGRPGDGAIHGPPSDRFPRG